MTAPLACALLLLVLVAFPSTTSAWTTGSGTCNASATSVTSQTGRHPITPVLGFYLGLPTSYSPSQPFQISLTNVGKNPNVTAFNGFLLYALDSQGRRQGVWKQDGGTTTTNLFNAVEAVQTSQNVYSCDAAVDATLTHSNGGPKTFPFALTYTPPSTDVGSLTFHGLVEYSNVLYYTQILTPWPVCSPTSGPCDKFDPSTLPSGPLPPPTASNSTPAGLDRVDSTSCGPFTPLPHAAVPAGYCVSSYAQLDNPRGIYVTDRGDLLVIETGSRPISGVSLLRDLNGDGVISGAGEVPPTHPTSPHPASVLRLLTDVFLPSLLPSVSM